MKRENRERLQNAFSFLGKVGAKLGIAKCELGKVGDADLIVISTLSRWSAHCSRPKVSNSSFTNTVRCEPVT